MAGYPHTDDAKRSRTMSRIRSKNTSIEVRLRKALWHSGIRYRVNYAKLPGSPDIAITKHKIVVFCDGEFWHGKDWKTKMAKIRSNRDYWLAKIERNIMRDNEANKALLYQGWKIIRFWGADIERDLNGCVEDVKEMIFQNQIETCSKRCDISEAVDYHADRIGGSITNTSNGNEGVGIEETGQVI